MPRSEASIHIDRTPDEVWAFISDPDNLPVWNSAVVTAEADGPYEKGTKVRGQVKFLGKRINYVNEVTEFDAPNRTEYRAIEAPFSWRGGSTLEPDGSGTKITSFLESENVGGFFGKLGEPIVAKMYSRQMEADLENLKEILESG